MATSFGEQLRLAREARGISLREISEQTRISIRYLEAIEADDYKRLPGGIFNKSFIKAYAKYIGYDEKEALEAYTRTAREHGDSPDEVASSPYQPRVYTDGNTRSPFVTLLLTVLILAILSLGVYAALHWYQRRTTPSPETSPAAAPNTQGTQSAATNSPQPAAVADDFNVEISARGENVWIKTRVDDGEAADSTLEPNETKQFKPSDRLSVMYSKSRAKSLELKINGRPARLPTEGKGVIEIVLTKGDYEKFLQ
jgi:cytoskeleton protein RodZ